MDGITELTQDMAGTYSVRTSSGTAYLVCLDEPRHVIRLAADTAPVGDYTALESAALRRDGEEITLIFPGPGGRAARSAYPRCPPLRMTRGMPT